MKKGLLLIIAVIQMTITTSCTKHDIIANNELPEVPTEIVEDDFFDEELDVIIQSSPELIITEQIKLNVTTGEFYLDLTEEEIQQLHIDYELYKDALEKIDKINNSLKKE